MQRQFDGLHTGHEPIRNQEGSFKKSWSCLRKAKKIKGQAAGKGDE